MVRSDDSVTLSRLFHLNSEPWLNIEAYESDPGNGRGKQIGDPDDCAALPNLPPAKGVRAVIAARQSCRAWRSTAMPLAALSELLGGAFGVVRVLSLPAGMEMSARAAPSAGGLYPLELYALCHDVTGLPDGLYHYNVGEHVLEPLRPAPPPDVLRSVLLCEPFVEHANVVVWLTAVFDRTQRKYGPRGYRYILFEAGHVAQNLCLLAAERGLGSLCVGGFVDRAANRLLQVDGLSEAALYAIALGWPEHPTGDD
jgi:SagB-type dehydrogenase family enzyme